MSASTEVSAGISSSIACARSPARSARLRAASSPSRQDVAVSVEDVVDHLEEHPELLAEVAPRALLLAREAGGPERQRDRRVEEAPGLQPVDRLEIRVRLHRVEVLAADHPERQLGELARDVGGRVRRRQAERLREQRVSGEHGLPLAMRGPDRRLPATLRVVVERRAGRRGRARSCARARAPARRASPAQAPRRAPRRRPARSPAGRACRPYRRGRTRPIRAGRADRARAAARRGPVRRAPSARQACASDSRFARSIESISSLAAASNSPSRSTASSSDSQPSSFWRSCSSRSTCS